MSRIYNLTGAPLNIFVATQLISELSTPSKYVVSMDEIPSRVIESSIPQVAMSRSKYGGVSNDRGIDNDNPVVIYVETVEDVNFNFDSLDPDDIVVVNTQSLWKLMMLHPDVHYARPIRPVFNTAADFVGYMAIAIIEK